MYSSFLKRYYLSSIADDHLSKALVWIQTLFLCRQLNSELSIVTTYPRLLLYFRCSNHINNTSIEHVICYLHVMQYCVLNL